MNTDNSMHDWRKVIMSSIIILQGYKARGPVVVDKLISYSVVVQVQYLHFVVRRHSLPIPSVQPKVVLHRTLHITARFYSRTKSIVYDHSKIFCQQNSTYGVSQNVGYCIISYEKCGAIFKISVEDSQMYTDSIQS